jgi:tetratricopeptide (TPR) repeat protein
MSITEIEKLREKVQKDPNSRLYVPLAEEYRKEGRMDEAIEVLQKGLERHPGYMSARVSLGKIYYAKGQMDEARIEFETVTKSIPDNLFAHKKLAEIYRDTGKKDLAIKAFRTVLNLNPMDEETLNSLSFLEGVSAEQALKKLQEPVAPPEESPSEAMVLEQTTHDQQKVEETKAEETKVEENEESVEELDAFKDSLFRLKAEAAEEIQEEILTVEEEVSSEAEELPEEADEEWTLGEVVTASGIEAVEEEVSAETIEIPEEADEELFFGDTADALRAEDLKAAGEVEAGPEDIFTPLKDKSLTELTAEMTPEAGSKSQKDKGLLLQTADRFISEGKYLGAINVYQQILAVAAGDKQTLQRIEELRSLLKLMGKDKEILISKLNAFLSALKKRGDEFHRCS